MKRKLLAGLIAATVALSGTALAQKVAVTFSNGTVIGSQEAGIEAFKGIPYSQPPVGALRWQPPQPVKSWSGERQAVNYGNDCLQEPFPGDAAPVGVAGLSEDCLTINVWRPLHSDGKSLPVMVWVYGGGFVNGGSSPTIYSGAEFARNGVVFVSFNYRIGRFGFFAHPALASEPLRGNYGLMDQIAALQWVQKNIADFGGNAKKVTLFGESAGGFSVISLLTTPQAQGLFQQAIIESGSGRHNITPNLTWQQAEQAGLAFAQSLGIKGAGADALQALRKLPASALVNGLNMATMQTDKSYSGPMIDGRLIVAEPQERFTAGEFTKVPLIVGTTDSDIGFAPRVNDLQQALKPLGNVDAVQARSAYDPQGKMSAQQVADTIASDQFMVEPARFLAQEISRHNVPVWQYRFGYVAESIRQPGQGAAHATEIPYVFNTLKGRYGEAVTAQDSAVARQMHQYWVNFAKSANPNGEGLPVWQPYQQQKDNLLIFPNSGAKDTAEMADPWGKRLDLISKIQ